jgi:hypothetical protein
VCGAEGYPSSWQKNEFTIDFCLCGTILNLKVFCFGAIPDRIIELMNVVQKVTGQKTDTFFMDGTVPFPTHFCVFLVLVLVLNMHNLFSA